MVRAVALYGAALAGLAFAVEWIDSRHAVRAITTELYIAGLATIFALLGVWIGNRFTARTASGPFETNHAAIASTGLTARECEVLERLARGASNKEIARALAVSPNTVKTHIASISQKLGVSGRGKAVDLARSLSIVR